MSKISSFAVLIFLHLATCNGQACTDGDVRLFGGRNEFEGLIELCYEGDWGTVCDRPTIDDSIAEVVCRQLNLSVHDPKVVQEYYKELALPVHVYDVQCSGSEENLLNCTYNNYNSSSSYYYCFQYDDVGVSCAPPCSDGDVRLLLERVQICHNQTWGYVCYDRDWNVEDASVVCRELGLLPPQESDDYYDYFYFYDDYDYDFSEYFYYRPTFPLFEIQTNCRGSEIHLSDCILNSTNIDRCKTNRASLAPCSDHEPCNQTGDLNLRNIIGEENVGRLEICYDGYWGSICDDYATDTVATVACHILGYARNAEISSFHQYYQHYVVLPNIPIVLDDLICTGGEISLLDCYHIGINNHNCRHFEDIVVICREKECNGSDIHLTGGQTAFDGIVEICDDEVWVPVCDDKWDYRAATVVCRQLGYYGDAYAMHEYGSNIRGSDIISCTGNETTLFSCFQRSISDMNCTFGVPIAAVICTGTTCDEGAIRLVGGHSIKEGRVQVCSNGEWHSVCGDGWSEREAAVVCHTLGYSNEYDTLFLASFGGDASSMLQGDIHCNGDEMTFSDCMLVTNGNLLDCKQTAGVICEVSCVIRECTESIGSGYFSDEICYCNSECFHKGQCCPNSKHLLSCFDDVECLTEDVRLVGGATNSSGVVEICVDGVWGTVCDYFNEWNYDNAAVICRQLNLPISGASPLPFSTFESLNHPVLFDSIQCTGSEAKILDCSHASIGNHFCSQFSQYTMPNVAIYCGEYCDEGAVRLVDGTDISNGRVEICQNGIWGSICYDDDWDIDDARVVCRQLGYNLNEVEVTDIFGPGNPVLMSDVECTGSEKELYLCESASIGTHSCQKYEKSAGVICSKYFDELKKCEDRDGTPPSSQNIINNMDRFGVCEEYTGHIEVCNEVYTPWEDYVFVSISFGTQESVSEFLEREIPPYLESNSPIHGKPCYNKIRELICKYYLSPCGTETVQYPPYSICHDDCLAVQIDCPDEWKTAHNGLDEHNFINCNHTSAIIFPLHSCCVEQNDQVQYETPDSTGGVIGGVVTALLIGLIGIITVVLLYFIYRRKRKQKKMEQFQRDIFARVSNVEEPSNQTLTGIEMKTNPYAQTRPSVSGHSSLAVDEQYSRSRLNSGYYRQLTRGKFLIKYENLSQLESIGQGEFGIVYRARLDGNTKHEVAVKTLKGDFDQLEVEKFVEESLKMSRFKHAHVMGLIGVCLDAGPAPYIVMPYMANGSLLEYLKKHRNKLVFTQDTDEDQVQEVMKRLMVMCCQIASGMEYLAAEKYIHRDLAARNCMINSHFIIKITDFGLSEDVFLRNYYREGVDGEMTKLPFKWMAPESLSDGHFSEKSDVWSYGVTMWEIFSGGKFPYPATNPVSLMQMLECGERLPKPYNTACSDNIYMMMLQCWEAMPDKRPSFEILYKNTSKYIEGIAGYLEMAFNPFASHGHSGTGETESTVETQEKMGRVEPEISVQITPPTPDK